MTHLRPLALLFVLLALYSCATLPERTSSDPLLSLEIVQGSVTHPDLYSGLVLSITAMPLDMNSKGESIVIKLHPGMNFVPFSENYPRLWIKDVRAQKPADGGSNRYAFVTELNAIFTKPEKGTILIIPYKVFYSEVQDHAVFRLTPVLVKYTEGDLKKRVSDWRKEALARGWISVTVAE